MTAKTMEAQQIYTGLKCLFPFMYDIIISPQFLCIFLTTEHVFIIEKL